MSRTLPLTAAASILFATVVAFTAEKEPVMLKVGDKAPSFTVKDDQGRDWKSEEHFGKKIVVVYFYPADMTGGCTAQACAFRDDMGKLADQDVEVVGVSGDSVRNHQLFKKAHNLNFALLADEEGEVARKFGVPYTEGARTVTAVIDGKEEELVRTITTRRWTFVIDKQGKVAYKDENVNAREDSKVVMDAIRKLKAGG